MERAAFTSKPGGFIRWIDPRVTPIRPTKDSLWFACATRNSQVPRHRTGPPVNCSTGNFSFCVIVEFQTARSVPFRADTFVTRLIPFVRRTCMKCTIGRTLLREADYRPSRYTQCSNYEFKRRVKTWIFSWKICVISFEKILLAS